MPPGSARFFYRDINELLRALLAQYTKEHDEALLLPLRSRDLRSWRTLIAVMVERSARFQRKHPVFAKLTISGQTLPELKRLDREADRLRGEAVIGLLDRYFIVPRIKNAEKAVYFATEIVDLAFTLSMNESGRITVEWVRFAKEAATAILTRLFGGDLEPRPSPPKTSDAP